MSDKKIIPPQPELKRELRDLDSPGGMCRRCGATGQRFLHRCPKCGRRHRRVRRRSSLNIPASW